MVVPQNLVKQFTHQFVTPPQVTQINDPETGRRCYEVPGGYRYTSVTNLLGELPNKGLDQWRKRKGAKAADAIANSAKARGSLLHGLIEKYLLNQDLVYDTKSPIQKILFKQVQTTLNSIDNITLIEKPLYSHKMKLAGTPDTIGEYGKKLSTIDFKTSTKIKEERYIQNYFAQCGAYCVMYKELFGVNIEQVVIIIAVEESSQPQVFKKDSDECFQILKDYAKRLVEHRESTKLELT